MPEFWINMGPQHPMTHGLWNMKVKVDGETITDAKPEIGYLHRGYEKIMEVREFQKNVVLTDRLCYVSSITWSHAYCLAVEKMMGIETPERGQWIRVIALELQRVASHLMWLASYGPDLGLLTGLLWCLRERELFLDLIQLMSGARMNQNYPRVGGVRNDLPENFEAMCKRSIEHFLEKVKNEYPQIFQESKVFRMRTEGVGTISAADAINWGGLRAAGMARRRGRRLVRAVRGPVQRAERVVQDHPAGPGEDAEDRSVPGEAAAAGGGRRVRQDGGLPRRGPVLRDRGRRRPAVPCEDP